MRVKKQERSILLGDKVVKTTDKPKWIIGCLTQSGSWFYLLKGSVYDSSEEKKIYVERYTDLQVKDLLDFFVQYPTELVKDFKAVSFLDFAETVGGKKIVTIDSEEEWFEYLDMVEIPKYKVKKIKKMVKKTSERRKIIKRVETFLREKNEF